MTQSPAPAFSHSRLAGAALGAMCGDALGMPVEGWSHQDIERQYGRLDAFLEGRLEAGSYTDDSQMMIAILETLAQRGTLDPAYLAARFLALYEPRRGYGGRVDSIMQQLARGAPWDQVATDSWGNGGAMRVGVLGVYFAHDDQACCAAALRQCAITHTHARGLAGAAAQALSVALAARLGAAAKQPYCASLVNHVASLVEPIDSHTASRLRALPRIPRGDESQARRVLTSEYACDVSAPESLPPAIGAFLAAASPEQAIVLAVSLGGDTDTIGAMTGALAGAYWGLEAIPPAWLDRLENQEAGRDHVLRLCRDICGENG
ncbi:MAG: ADP-ribosylglycohydrolase family protein [Desulfarculaceae bacterium]|nr:ADP-ribosylglycohydrolase family protein [Desulfarculaceae bacterium]MCF8073359.1 ADP-ribosylglycohydrolase family protein [Desulfarculaceae bacterium]MCF8103531.1 ADP-ribosylglycohydrolase family protein [Desulfarculaceae bacterium]MCF8115770.1 ADP-ribosylglycohydrolase family protein [Desulfarculaceae bacterium]